ncbi:hypothetical protein WICMUC_002826 [Wickerhamomyces mucosus]|uniref:DNA/RNA-binding protein Alba-like domain-containing protein n=1 Tax=Wickerhamomyces mucosus TaxID=1378264 RepID=A0A9P8TE20_9ASCO|nr:hypothetical protein WICMUC_002826 [Wickerhamomyces mucosus]
MKSKRNTDKTLSQKTPKSSPTNQLKRQISNSTGTSPISHKKQKPNTVQSQVIRDDSQSQDITEREILSGKSDSSIFTLSERLSLNNPITVKKDDKMTKKIDFIYQKLTKHNDVSIMACGEHIPKLLSISEIIKVKIKEQNLKFTQYNKLEKLEYIRKKSEIEDKKMRIPVLYIVLRKTDNSQTIFKEWTKQSV